MRVLAVDVGGTHIKLLATGQTEPVRLDSSRELTAHQMVEAVQDAVRHWEYDVVSIGYPGPVSHGTPTREPVNLGRGWVGFDYAAAFGRPVRLINDAAMQAVGLYEGGRMLFLGLGTGLGTALVLDGLVHPLEVAHLPYRKRRSYEDYVGLAGLERLGKRRWRVHVAAVCELMLAAFQVDYVMLGGGNARLMRTLPDRVRRGRNDAALDGAFRMWEAVGA